MRTAKSPVKSKKALARASDQRLIRHLRIALGISVFAGITAGALGYWDQFSGATPDKIVTVYRVHGCRCVFAWASALRNDGYVVQVRESKTLDYIRGSLHVPARLQGCHVAQYLDYFIEGHVSGAQLQRLNAERPAALGLAASADPTSNARLTVDAAHTFLVDLDGRSTVWRKKGQQGAG